MRRSGTYTITLLSHTHTHTTANTYGSTDPGVSNSGVKEHNDERSPGSNGAFCVWK